MRIPTAARKGLTWVLTGLAILLVLLALTVPHRVQEIEATTFVRLPIEALVFLAVVLALPARLGRVRALLALAAGAVLGLVAIVKALDMSFFQALNRPFDVAVDWRYGGSLVELLRDSFGEGLGTTLLVAAGVAGVVLLALTPLAVLRLTRLASRHRRSSARVVAALAAVWLVLALLDVRAGGGAPLASSDTAGYVQQKVSDIPADLRDQREFARSAQDDPLSEIPANELLT